MSYFVTASHATKADTTISASYADFALTASFALNSETVPAGTVSSSIQIDHDATTNFTSSEHFIQSAITEVGTVVTGDVSAILPAGVISGSLIESSSYASVAQTVLDTPENANTASYVDYTNIDNLPTLVSGSGQISYTGITDVPSGIVSGSWIESSSYSETASYYDSSNDTVLSSSYAITSSYSSNADLLDSQEGSYYLDYDNFTNVPADIFSGSHGDLTGLDDDDHTQYHTVARLNSWVTASLTTANITEETNLYYTDVRVDAFMDSVGVISGSMIIDSASYALDVDRSLLMDSSSYAHTSSYALDVDRSLLMDSSSFSITSSYALDVDRSLLMDSSSYASTASFANDFEVAQDFTLSGIPKSIKSQALFYSTSSGDVSYYDNIVYDENVIMDALGFTASLHYTINNNFSAGSYTTPYITDNGDGTLKFNSGSGIIRTSDSATGELVSFEWDDINNISIPTASTQWLYMDYNGGSPTVNITADLNTINHNTEYVVGRVYNDGTAPIHIQELGAIASDRAHRVDNRLWELYNLQRASGMLVSAPTDLHLIITKGIYYVSTIRFESPELDSSGSDTFNYWYEDGAGGWTEVTGSTEVDNLHYDDGTGTLDELIPQRFGIHWLYLVADKVGHYEMVYGTDSYTLVNAELVTPPTNIPPVIQNMGLLIAKIIVKKSEATVTEITNPFTTVFSSTAAADHGNLVGLAEDDHTQYYNTDRLNTWITASVVPNSVTASYVESASYATIAENVLGSIESASFATTASYVSSIQIDHDGTTNYVVNKHLDWTISQAPTKIHIDNYATGSVVSASYAVNADKPYGEIYTFENTGSTSLSTQNVWYQFLGFNNDGISKGITPDYTNDHITIDTTGNYKIHTSYTVASPATNKDYEFQVKKNNGTGSFENIIQGQGTTTVNDDHMGSLSGLISLTAGDTVELWARCTTALTGDIIFKYANLSVIGV